MVFGGFGGMPLGMPFKFSSHGSSSWTSRSRPTVAKSPPVLLKTIRESNGVDCLPESELADDNNNPEIAEDGKIDLVLERKFSKATKYRKIDKKTREFVAAILTGVICAAIGIGVVLYLYYQLLYVDMTRPEDDRAYLSEALTRDEAFFSYFDFDFKRSLGVKMNHQRVGTVLMDEINSHQEDQRLLGGNGTYRTHLAFKLVAGTPTDLNITELAISTIGAQRALALQLFLTKIVICPKQKNLQNLTIALNSFELEIEQLKTFTPETLHKSIDASWVEYKTHHTPAISACCMKTIHGAKELLEEYMDIISIKKTTCLPDTVYRTEPSKLFVLAILVLTIIELLMLGVVFSGINWAIGMINKRL